MISVVICTYKRASSLKILLKSIEKQTLTPFEVLIIDGSPDNDTKTMIELEKYNLPLQYWSVPPEERGLTRQRNYGITKINQRATIISV